jgi:hypothetical protein
MSKTLLRHTLIKKNFFTFLLKPYLYTFDVKLLTKGSDFLTYQDNTTIFRHAFKYIKDSKRFTNCLNDLKNQHTFPKVFILLSFLSYIVST